MVYDEPSGLRDYDRATCPTSTTSSPTAARRSPIPGRGLARRRDRGGQGLRPFDHSLHFRHHRPVQGRGAVRPMCIDAARDTVAFDKLTDRDEALAYLPIAWVGDHYLNYAQQLVAGFCIACPKAPIRRCRICGRSGRPSISPRRARSSMMLTRVMIRMEDAGPIKRRAVPLFHRRGAALRRDILNGEPVPLTAGSLYAPARRWSTDRSRTCSASRACGLPIPPARRSARTCSRSFVRSG